MTAVALVASLLAASTPTGAARPPVALIASPAHVALAGSARAPVAVTNSGTEPVVVDVARAGFALDLRGRPRAVSRRISWLAVVPRSLVLAPGATAPLTVSAKYIRGMSFAAAAKTPRVIDGAVNRQTTTRAIVVCRMVHSGFE